MPPPRWVLHLEARCLRLLMAIGMFLHRLAPPRPPPVTFDKWMKASTSARSGDIGLQFYTPRGYLRRAHNTRYPAVVNFHGGGFTVGTGTDDARWARSVVQEAGAICVSVDYRLAPEHPFPTAVDDGVDAILYLIKHADELGIDAKRIAVSGFSAGGNLAFTVPLRLRERGQSNDIKGSSQGSMSGESEDHTVVAVVAWYPCVDFSKPRGHRRATNIRPDQELAQAYSNLFDASYLYPTGGDMSDPFLSPGVASDEMLRSLPEDIAIYTCEWDGLCMEGRSFGQRLEKLGKRVKYRMIEGVPHAWDKAPNPIRTHPEVESSYKEACAELRRVFDEP